MSERIDAIRARLEAATAGPWAAIQKTWRNRTSGYTWSAYGIEQAEEVYGNAARAISYATHTGQIARNDADLIAHAPADLAYLLEQAATQEAQAAAVAVALAQAKALLRRTISDRQMMSGAYIPEALVRQIRAFLDAVED